MPVVLTGFKHVGKTTVGTTYAQQYGHRFYDLDHLINALFRKSPPLLWNNPPKMHALEFLFLSNLLTHAGILALGGATVLDPHNRRLLKHFTPVIYLYRTPELVKERLDRLGYPSTLHPSTFYEAFKIRDHFHRAVSHYVLDVSSLTTDQICGRLWDLIGSEHSLPSQPGGNHTVPLSVL